MSVLKGFTPLSLLTGVLLTTYTVKRRYELLAESVMTRTHMQKVTHRVGSKQLCNYATSSGTRTRWMFWFWLQRDEMAK